MGQLSHMESCIRTLKVLGTDQSREEPGHVFETGCVLGNETFSFQAERKEDFFFQLISKKTGRSEASKFLMTEEVFSRLLGF